MAGFLYVFLGVTVLKDRPHGSNQALLVQRPRILVAASGLPMSFGYHAARYSVGDAGFRRPGMI
jgi:hypothetical protein